MADGQSVQYDPRRRKLPHRSARGFSCKVWERQRNSGITETMRAFYPMDHRGIGRFLDSGEMGRLIRGRDWSNTALGAFETWPHSLRTAVDILLRSRYAMFVWWGRELINLYNDAYRPFLGHKHPDAVGRSARNVWPEI